MQKIRCILISLIFQLILSSNLVPPTNVIIEICPVLLFTLNLPRILHIITEELIFYSDKIMLMATSKNSRVFNFAILLKLRKFYAREIYMFYGSQQYRSY